MEHMYNSYKCEGLLLMWFSVKVNSEDVNRADNASRDWAILSECLNLVLIDFSKDRAGAEHVG
jgi:hypothetical protein